MITLITHPSDKTAFNSYQMLPYFQRYFNVVRYNGDDNFDRSSSLVVKGLYNTGNSWYQSLRDKGFKIVVDHMYERGPLVGPSPLHEQDAYVLASRHGIWFYTVAVYRQKGYQNYQPNKTYKYQSLMKISAQRTTRSKLYRKLQPYLANMLYSYRDKGIHLPNDIPQPEITDILTIGHWYCHNSWYDDTYFSVVPETYTWQEEWARYGGEGVFLTEKTFCPLAFYHPMLLVSIEGSLQYLRDLGFETFDNIFDESYDSLLDIDQRIDAVVNNVANFKEEPYSDLTWQKLEHNKNLLFNDQVINNRIYKEIVIPLCNLVETI